MSIKEKYISAIGLKYIIISSPTIQTVPRLENTLLHTWEIYFTGNSFGQATSRKIVLIRTNEVAYKKKKLWINIAVCGILCIKTILNRYIHKLCFSLDI